MSKRTEMNRQRRWNRIGLSDQQARANAERDMAEMSQAIDAGSRLIWPVLAMMAESSKPNASDLTLTAARRIKYEIEKTAG